MKFYRYRSTYTFLLWFVTYVNLIREKKSLKYAFKKLSENISMFERSWYLKKRCKFIPTCIDPHYGILANVFTRYKTVINMDPYLVWDVCRTHVSPSFYLWYYYWKYLKADTNLNLGISLEAWFSYFVCFVGPY